MGGVAVLPPPRAREHPVVIHLLLSASPSRDCLACTIGSVLPPPAGYAATTSLLLVALIWRNKITFFSATFTVTLHNHCDRKNRSSVCRCLSLFLQPLKRNVLLNWLQNCVDLSNTIWPNYRFGSHVKEWSQNCHWSYCELLISDPF